jgi:hypothetical protein
MDNSHKTDPGDFASYLQSIVQLNAIQRITQSLDNELTDSQRAMSDIKTMFDSISTVQNTNQESANNYLRYEDMSKFLDADPPKLLLPDMVENNRDVDLDDVIATMKVYAEDLKKNFIHTEPQSINTPKEITSLDIEQYASSLDQLSRRLLAIKLNKRDDCKSRNTNLEEKLTQLCEDVNMFNEVLKLYHIIILSLLAWLILILFDFASIFRWFKPRLH